MQRRDWLFYSRTVIYIFVLFAVATFCAGVYFTHLHSAPLSLTLSMVALYLFVIIASTTHIAKTLPFAVVMLLIPITPLFILLLVISFLPLWQKLL